MDFPTERLDALEVGQQAEVVLDAFGGDQFSGRVVRIGTSADIRTRVLPVTIEALLDKLQSETSGGGLGTHFSELRAISASLCVADGDPFGDNFPELFFSETPTKAFKIRVIASKMAIRSRPFENGVF